MKKNRILYFMLSIVLLFQGCEKDTMTYAGETDGISGIYFLYGPNYTKYAGGLKVYTYRDSLEYSFAKLAADIPEATVNLPVKVLGNLSDKDRTYKVKVVGGSAVEGIDYVPLEAEYVLPANQPETFLPIRLKRTSKLKDVKLNMIVSLVENDNFKLLLPTKENGSDGTVLNATQLKIIFSEFYAAPWDWNWGASDYFGDFTVEKFEFINTLMGWAPSDWEEGKVKLGMFNYAARKVQEELQRRADNNDPVYEKDKVTFMQLAGKYMVDYSRYD